MSKPTVLYIDPNYDSREIHQQLLEIFGYRAVCAATPDRGLDLARGELPAVVITELFERPPAGLDLVRTLKGDERMRSVPVVVLSAWALPEDREGALRAGASAFLSKPCEAETLKRTLVRITGRARREGGVPPKTRPRRSPTAQ